MTATRTSLAAVAFVLAACAARAQEPPPQAPPAPAQQPAATPPAPSAAAPAAAATPNGISREKLARIYLIRQYETVLTNAVKTGANSLAGMLKLNEPTSLFVTGNARARGFELEGYGVVFDVDVPTMMQSVLWSAQMLQRQQELEKWREISRDPQTPEGMRRVADGEVRRLERLFANQQPIPAMPVPPLATAAQGMAVAQTTDAPASAIRDAALAPVADPRSADEMYTDVIKNALIEAILTFGPALRLGDDEWLTVAARASSPAVPNQMDDSSSILIRIKGADLTGFLTGKISREAVLKKIEIKEG